jgi:hypothetical protein
VRTPFYGERCQCGKHLLTAMRIDAPSRYQASEGAYHFDVEQMWSNE